ncbi:MAG: dihydropteroate synthase [Methanoculleaceae archaeon]
MYTCHIGPVRIGAGAPVEVMGVINCSPESFYSGSYVPPSRVADRAREMVAEGAAIIDVGARSTAPGSPAIPVEEELRRMEVALSGLDGTGIPVSVDTPSPQVLEAALAHDVAVINDIGGLVDDRYARIAADSGLPVIAMATFRKPGDPLGFTATLDALRAIIGRCERYGIDEYVLDPGIGRWIPDRTPAMDWEICQRFDELLVFERPLLAVISRKSFIGDLLGRKADERLAGSLALTALLVDRGASLIRTHDVAWTCDAVKVAMAAGRPL